MGINPSLVTKIAIGFAGVTAVSAGGYFAHDHFSKEIVSELIKKDKLTLLTSKDTGAEGLKRGKEYVEEGNNVGKINNYTTNASSENDIPQSFKDACYNRTTGRTRSNDYEKIAKFCTKSFSIASLISQETGISLITADKGDQKGNTVWAKYVKEENNLLDLNDWPVNETKKTTVPDDYKEKCEAKQRQEVRNKEDENYLAVKNFCSEIG